MAYTRLLDLYSIWELVLAKKRKKNKPSVKREIVQEAGGKCANPGCANWRVHIHHIKHWAVYQSDDPDILIAVCPTCHDAIHHGSLEFTDELLYLWKEIGRTEKPSSTNIYIEPSENIKLLTGSIALSTKNEGATVFELSELNKLSFRILDGDISLVSLKVSNLSNVEKLRVSENHVRVNDTDTLQFEQVPGHVKVSTKDSESFISKDYLQKMQAQQPEFMENGELTLLELQVTKPGQVKVKGCWVHKEFAVIITDKSLSFIRPGLKEPISLVGKGEGTVLNYVGPITHALFNFEG